MQARHLARIEPVRLRAKVVHGFGRGSKQLGFPTANMQVNWDRDMRDLSEQERAMRDFAETHRAGIYCAWGSIEEAVGGQEVHKVALSMGWNPTFTDVKAKTVEPWILHTFDQDFYGCHLRLLVLAYIRPELKFDTIEQLKQEIALDGEFCAAVLGSELLSFQGDSFLRAWSTPAPVKLQAAPMPAGISVSRSLTKALEEMPPLEAGCVRLFLARHGETTANEKGLLCGGDLDSELNSNGEKQAEELAQEFCSLVTPEIIGSSSQRRAVRSADLVARCCPKSERLVIDDLREMRYGLLAAWLTFCCSGASVAVSVAGGSGLNCPRKVLSLPMWVMK